MFVLVISFGSSLSDGEEDDDDIKLGVILPYSPTFPWSIRKTGPAIRLAVESVNNQTLLGGRRLQILLKDSKCSDTIGPLVAIEMYHTKNVHVFIGPACDYAVAPVARFSPYWNIPVITAGAPVTAFSDKAGQYKLLTRIGSTYAKLGEFFGKMFEQFNWWVGGVIVHSNTDHRQGRSDCFFAMDAVYNIWKERYSIYKKQYGDKFKGAEELWYKVFDENLDPPQHNLTKILLEASTNARGNLFLV